MRILVIGDAIIDVTVACESAQSSGGQPILRQVSRTQTRGGAAGVALVAESLGAQVRFLGTLAARITRIRCAGREDLRIDETIQAPYQYYRPHVHHAVQYILSGWPDAVILADYAKGALDAAARRQLIGAACECGVPVVVGAARGVAWSEYAGATIISRNEHEADGWHEVAASGQRVCVTYGRSGLRIQQGSEWEYGREHAVEVDPLGCGDSVVAALAIGLAERMPLDTLSRFAAAVGACQASRGPGVQPVGRAEADLLTAQPVAASL